MVEALDKLDSSRIDYLPTPSEIHDACESIRGTWTLHERRRRFVGPELPDELPRPWQPPTIDTSGFRLAMSGVASE